MEQIFKMVHEAAEEIRSKLTTNKSSESLDPKVGCAGDEGGAASLPGGIQRIQESDASADPDSHFSDFGPSDPQCLNVLILGETGTGKSTFINAIANYYTYGSFYEAEKRQLQIPIPATITVSDKRRRKHRFSVGTPSINETQTIGASATQNVQTYFFPTEHGVVLRLMDTPGMGDPRGVDTDDQNCENILSYLSGYEKLHAVCFLVKSNNSRITVLFEYCFKQILSRLDISASNNIIFIFTNTKGDHYSGGNTYFCLEKIVNQIMINQPQVHINFDRNLFYLENEAFKFLAALQNGIEISDKVRQSAVDSWNQSTRECRRLISYIKGDAYYRPLPPHTLKDSISINEARRLIDNISKPLADISDHVQDNICVLKKHEAILKLENESLEDMKNNLYIPVVNLKVVDLDKPATTCIDSKCLEHLQVEDKKLTHYKQRCHEPCYLKNVPALNIGHPSLRECYAMGGLENCQFCGCHFSSHMHIYQQTEKFCDKIKDQAMLKNIQNKKQALEARKNLIKQSQDRRTALENEQEEIVEAIAMFAHFVQKSAITPFNDCYKSYILYLITRERGRGARTDEEMLYHLSDMLRRYDAKKKLFDDTLERGRKAADYDGVTAESVINRIRTLFDLEFSGRKLKEMMEGTEKCRGEEHKKSWINTAIGAVKGGRETEAVGIQDQKRSWLGVLKEGFSRITKGEHKGVAGKGQEGQEQARPLWNTVIGIVKGDYKITVKEEPKITVKEEPKITVKEEPKITVKEEPKITVKEEPKITVKEEPKITEKEEPKITEKEEPKITVREAPKITVKEEPKITVKEEPKITEKEEPKITVKEEPKATGKKPESEVTIAVDGSAGPGSN